VIASLSRSCNGSKSAAFKHKHITPPAFVDVHEISARGTRSTKALVTPWYSQGDILGYINKHPGVSKIALVSDPTYNTPSLSLLSQVVQVSKALEHLHKFDIIHGNIYPVSHHNSSRILKLSS
jgi:serine/threonine protein kinase